MLLVPINDFESIKAAYMDVIEHTPEIERYARWVYGKHPTDEAIRSYIDNGEMVALMDGDQIVAIAAIVMHQGPDYEVIAWADSLASDEVATLHLLAVCPGYRGHELGMVMLEQAMELAGQNGKKALRLDVLASNLPAQRMYEKAGFSYRGTQKLYAENTGMTDFLYYEKALHPLQSGKGC